MSTVKKSYTIDGEEVYDVDTFASITGKSRRTIYTYIHIGNSVRTLRAKYTAGKPYILASELTEYPFTKIGPNSSHRIYHFDRTGKKIDCPTCSASCGIYDHGRV